MHNLLPYRILSFDVQLEVLTQICIGLVMTLPSIYNIVGGIVTWQSFIAFTCPDPTLKMTQMTLLMAMLNKLPSRWTPLRAPIWALSGDLIMKSRRRQTCPCHILGINHGLEIPREPILLVGRPSLREMRRHFFVNCLDHHLTLITNMDLLLYLMLILMLILMLHLRSSVCIHQQGCIEIARLILVHWHHYFLELRRVSRTHAPLSVSILGYLALIALLFVFYLGEFNLRCRQGVVRIDHFLDLLASLLLVNYETVCQVVVLCPLLGGFYLIWVRRHRYVVVGLLVETARIQHDLMHYLVHLLEQVSTRSVGRAAA